MSGKNPRYVVEKSGCFYARVVVPKPLRAILGNQLSVPVGKSRSEMKRNLESAVAQLKAKIDAARVHIDNEPPTDRPAIPRKGRPLSPHQLAVSHYQRGIAFDDFCRTDWRYAAHGFPDEKYVDSLRQAVAGSASDAELEQAVGKIIDQYRERGNVTTEPGTREWREAAVAVAVAELEALRRSAERDEGDFTGRPVHPLLTEKPKIEVPKDSMAHRVIGPDSTKSLKDLLPIYVKEKQASPAHDNEMAVTVRMFDEYLGEARPAYKIMRQDVNGFKRALSDAPSNYKKRFPGMTLPDAIKANSDRDKPFPLLNARTVNDKYLSKLHSLLNWCVRNEVVPDNQASGVKVEVVKSTEKPRIRFQPDDISRIFHPDRFVAPFTERQWAMLVALFSGMRASEEAQVKLDSIRTERGVLLFEVEERTKNLGSKRLVPVHSNLITLGLDKRIADLRSEGAAHLFPDWFKRGMESKAKAEGSGKPARLNQYFPRIIPKWFLDHYLDEVGISDSRKKWHSFRHTFRTGLEFAGVEESIADYLGGWKSHRAAAGYVHGVSVSKLKEAVEMLQFDGFDL